MRKPGFEAAKLLAGIVISSVRCETEPMPVAAQITAIETADRKIVCRHRIATQQRPVGEAGSRKRIGRGQAVVADTAAQLRHGRRMAAERQMPKEPPPIAGRQSIKPRVREALKPSVSRLAHASTY